MAISSTAISKQVQKALQTLGDLRSDITYHSITVGDYNPATDSQTITDTTYSVKGVLVGLTQRETDQFPADVITQKLIVSGLDLVVTPKLNDQVTIGGNTWQVRKVKGVPGQSLWVLFIQEP